MRGEVVCGLWFVVCGLWFVVCGFFLLEKILVPGFVFYILLYTVLITKLWAPQDSQCSLGTWHLALREGRIQYVARVLATNSLHLYQLSS